MGKSRAPVKDVVQELGRRDATLDTASAPGPVEQAMSGGGEDIPYLTEMEAFFGVPLGHVSAWYDPETMAGCGAVAVTVRDNVCFASRNPPKEVVVHELTHVLQGPGGGDVRESGEPSQPGEATEKEADRAVSAFRSGSLPTGQDSDAAGEALGFAPEIRESAAGGRAHRCCCTKNTGAVDDEDGSKEVEKGKKGKKGGLDLELGGRLDLPDRALGLGFTNVESYEEDAFGKQTAKENHLAAFRKLYGLGGLDAPMKSEARDALARFGYKWAKEVHQAYKLQTGEVSELEALRDKNPDMVDDMKSLRADHGLQNIQISEGLQIYKVVVDTFIDDDGHAPTDQEPENLRDLDGRTSSLSASIKAAMYREPHIVSNLAGFTSSQLAFARDTDPVRPAKEAAAARKVRDDLNGLRADDCNLWNAMKETKFNWSLQQSLVSVWEVSTMLHEPALRKKTTFVNGNMTVDPDQHHAVDIDDESSWAFH